ncbi:MAG: nucleotidyl transferase AbiEii/AbiGii toxin family protein, partial [Chloroflexota bacterium]
IERVLEFGDEEAYRWLFGTYTSREIIAVVKSSRRLSRPTAMMLANFYNLPEGEARCLQIPFQGCFIADWRDIAAMKLVALSQRGTKKDFVDLFFLLREKLTLADLKTIVEQKFTGVRYNWTHVIRSLGYFEEAENDPMPLMATSKEIRDLTLREWREIKQFFKELQKEALRQIQQG